MATEEVGARRRDLAAVVVPGIAVAGSLLIRAAFWFRRAYNLDEFYFGYLAWLRSTPAAPVRDYYLANFTPISELWAPFYRWLPESFLPLDLARAAFLVLSVVLLFLVYRLTLSLTGSVAWSVAAVAVTSCEPSFMQRIGDVRADTVAAVLLMAAAVIIVNTNQPAKLVLAAVLPGLSVACSWKLIYALPFVVAGVTIAASSRRVTVFICACIAGCAPTLAYLAFRAATDGPSAVFETLSQTAYAVARQSHSHDTTIAALRSDPLFWVASAAAAVITIIRCRHSRDRRFYYAILATGFIALFVLRNTFLYPYNFVIMAPVMAPLLPGLELSRRYRTGIVVVVTMVVAVLATGATLRMLRQTNTEQRRLVEWVWSATSPREAVFDWQGFVTGRRSVKHWVTYGAMVGRYRETSWYSLADEWRSAGVTLMIPNYRFQWIKPSDRAFLEAHYVFIAPCLLAPGGVFQPAELARGPVIFDAMFGADYVIRNGGTTVSIDGARVTSPIVHLAAGPHRLEASAPVRRPVEVIFTTPLRQAAGPPPCPAGPMLFGYENLSLKDYEVWR